MHDMTMQAVRYFVLYANSTVLLRGTYPIPLAVAARYKPIGVSRNASIAFATSCLYNIPLILYRVGENKTKVAN